MVDASNGAVRLAGNVVDASQRAEVERTVQGVAGARAVENTLRSGDNCKRKMIE